MKRLLSAICLVSISTLGGCATFEQEIRHARARKYADSSLIFSVIHWQNLPAQCNKPVDTKSFQENLKKRVEDYLALHPDTNAEIKYSLLENQAVTCGMTQEQALLLLSEPNIKFSTKDTDEEHTNEYIVSKGTYPAAPFERYRPVDNAIDEVWVYKTNCGYYEEDRRFFRKGILIKMLSHHTGNAL